MSMFLCGTIGVSFGDHSDLACATETDVHMRDETSPHVCLSTWLSGPDFLSGVQTIGPTANRLGSRAA